MAASVLTLRYVTDRAEQPAEAATIGSCQVRERTESYPFNAQIGHPSKEFFEPAETAPLEAFGHVIGDGYVIVEYPPSLPADQLA